MSVSEKRRACGRAPQRNKLNEEIQ